MSSEQPPGPASSSTENAQTGTTARPVRRGRAAVELPEPFAGALCAYTGALAAAPLAELSRRTYASKVRQYLAWLAAADADGDPLATADGRDQAVRDYRTHLQAVLKRKPATVNNALAAVDDFYNRRGLGPADVARVEVPSAAPRALDRPAQIRYLRAVGARPSPRDQAIALVAFYAGARIGEIASLDIDDVRLCERNDSLRILGQGKRVREVPIHPQLRCAITGWLEQRRGWPGAHENPALFLNRRGQRLSIKTIHDIITAIADNAGHGDIITAHVLRHTFATTLVRGGTSLVTVAELLGHTRLESTRAYTNPTPADRTRALDLLTVDQ